MSATLIPPGRNERETDRNRAGARRLVTVVGEAAWQGVGRSTCLRAMRRVRVTTIALAIVEMTLLARTAIEGIKADTTVAEVLILPLLLSSIWLWYAGRRLERSDERAEHE
jgi:hypothetical protein